jgi:hypothetical protein
MYLTKTETIIPLNDLKYFIIKKNNWNSSIDIILQDCFNFNMINLFFIFKSYYLTDRVYISSLYFVLTNQSSPDNFFVYKKINHRKFSYMSLADFSLWIEDFLEIEKEYVKLYNFSGFRIVFHSTSIVNEEGLIYPIYPWGALLMGSYIKEKKASNVVFEKINYKLKYFLLLNTILKDERVRYRNISRKKKK